MTPPFATTSETDSFKVACLTLTDMSTLLPLAGMFTATATIAYPTSVVRETATAVVDPGHLAKKRPSSLPPQMDQPQRIGTQAPSSPTPSLPESVESWTSSRISNEWSISNNDQYRPPPLWMSTPILGDRGLPKEDAWSTGSLRLSLQVNLFDLVDDATLPLSPPEGMEDGTYIPGSHPPCCLLAWPETPRSLTPAWCSVSHNAEFQPHGAVCAECGGDATDLGGRLMLQDWWPERIELPVAERMTPDIATQQQRPYSWPAPTVGSEHYIFHTPQRDFSPLHTPPFPHSREPQAMSSHFGPDENAQELFTTAKRNRRLSLTSLRRSLSLSGAFGSRKAVARSPPRRSLSSSPVSTCAESLHSNPDERGPVSPTTSTAKHTDSACNAKQYHNQTVAVLPSHPQPKSGPQSQSRPHTSSFQAHIPSVTDRSCPSHGTILHGSSRAPSALGYYSKLASFNHPITPATPHRRSSSASSHDSAHRQPPSVPASPDMMDSDLEYDPNHFERHDLSGDLPAHSIATVNAAEPVGDDFMLEDDQFTGHARQAGMQDGNDEHATRPVCEDTPSSPSTEAYDTLGASGLGDTSQRLPDLQEAVDFNLGDLDNMPGVTGPTVFDSRTSLEFYDTILDSSPTLAPASAPPSPPALVSRLPPSLYTHIGGSTTPPDSSPTLTLSSRSSGAATTPQAPAEELAAPLQPAPADSGLRSLPLHMPTATRRTPPLAMSRGQSPRSGDRGSSHGTPPLADARSFMPSEKLHQETEDRQQFAGYDSGMLSGLMGSSSGYHGSRTDHPITVLTTHNPFLPLPPLAPTRLLVVLQAAHQHLSAHDDVGFLDHPPSPQLSPYHYPHSPPEHHHQRSRTPSQSAALPIAATQSSPPPSTPKSRSNLTFGPFDPHLHSFGSPRDTDYSSGSRRTSSRYSQLTYTSASSEGLSPTTPASVRHYSGQPLWAAENRPTVATVFEDELLDDRADHDRSYESVPCSSTQDGLRFAASSPSPHRLPTGHARGPITATTPSTSGSPKAKPDKSHPFAVKRERSPTVGDKGVFAQTPGIPGSRSFPSLYEAYRMSTNTPIVHQVSLVSAEEDVEEVICPVCCESLKSRLPGEKPHIVPECGHGLHEACFDHVYGDVPPEGSRKHIGLCGVCRKDMRVLPGGHERAAQKKNKLAALMGGEGGMPLSLPPGVISNFDDTSGDDPLEAAISSNGRQASASEPPLNIVVPNIKIKSEQPSVRWSKQGQQKITCMVTIEVPEALDQSYYPARSRSDLSPQQGSSGLPPSPHSTNSFPDAFHLDPFANVVADLRRRVAEYRQQGLDSIGQLKLFDILAVRKGQYAGDYNLYLFEQALVCITEERSEERKSSGFRKMFGSNSRGSGSNSQVRSVLKVKGLIHHLHVREVQDTSTSSEYTIELSADTDHGVDKFQIVFKDSSSHEMWKTTLRRLVDEANFPKTTRAASMPALRTSNRLSPPQSEMLEPPDSAMSSPQSCSGLCPGDLAFQVPIARHHTPIDLVIVISTPAPANSSSTTLQLKRRLMRSSLQFVLACMGPRDRVSIISSESGVNGTVRKTPLLNATRHDSRLKLENFIDGLGLGRLNPDEFEVPGFHDNHQDGDSVIVGVDAAINVGLDVVLGRKSKNPVTGLLLISDANDHPTCGHMNLVKARLDAAKVQVHAFGYGQGHNPAPLWVVSSHTRGTYTFVKEWYHLRDALAGAVGGLMSIALTNMKLRFTCQDPSFRVSKVSGASLAVVSSNKKEVDVDFQVLRHRECREILVEFKLVDPNGPPQAAASPTSFSQSSTTPTSFSQSEKSPVEDDRRSHHSSQRHLSLSPGGILPGSGRRRSSVYGAFDMLSIEDNMEELHAEVPVVEVDCSFHDPLAGRSAARLTNPVLLTLAVLPPSAPPPPTTMGDPSIIRRRMELLTSEMMPRAVTAASRRNFDLAKDTLIQTKRIVEKMTDDMRNEIKQSSNGGTRSMRETAILLAVEGLAATTQDIDMLLDGLEEGNKQLFEVHYRNYATQQAVILRTQRSWTVRTATELRYATPCVRALIQASGEYAARN